VKTARIAFLLGFLFFANCSTTSQQANEEALFFSEFAGPSKESGDCGGNALWLKEKEGIIESGEFALFEGGCKIVRSKIDIVEYNKESKKLIFTTTPPYDLEKFEVDVSDQNVNGVFYRYDKKKKKYILGHKVELKKLDYKKFVRALPGNFSE